MTFIPLPSPGGFSRATNRSFLIINYQSKSAANNSRVPVWAVSNTQHTNLRPNRRTAPRPLAMHLQFIGCICVWFSQKAYVKSPESWEDGDRDWWPLFIISDLITVSAQHVHLKCATPRAMLCIRSNQAFQKSKGGFSAPECCGKHVLDYVCQKLISSKGSLRTIKWTQPVSSALCDWFCRALCFNFPMLEVIFSQANWSVSYLI